MARRVEDMLGSRAPGLARAAARARGGAGRGAGRALRGRRRCPRRGRRARRRARAADARRDRRRRGHRAAARLLARGGRAAVAAARRGRARSPRPRSGSPTSAIAATRPRRSWSGSAATLGRELERRRRSSLDAERAARDRGEARAPRPPARAARPGQPARRARVRAGARPRREPRDPARRPRDGAVGAPGPDPRDRPQDPRRLRGDLRGHPAQLRGAGRAPVPRRPRAPAAGRRQPRPEAGARRRRARVAERPRPPTSAPRPRRKPTRTGDEFSTQGVEIEVTPAGKATRRLSLLSGGEKALVALAFVFAVFLARPSPFYILDEVEAALDDANIDRFLQLVRRFSDRAQFIIVTHQKRTMDAADVLYGVSMGKGGVTKVVSRKLRGRAAGARPSAARRPKRA